MPRGSALKSHLHNTFSELTHATNSSEDAYDIDSSTDAIIAIIMGSKINSNTVNGHSNKNLTYNKNCISPSETCDKISQITVRLKFVA